ncbi:AttH component of AttEFGH ABC transport system [Olavius algarvensis Delta 1 endosymbiont]|nr:AttH component of AttEFGH ABC transport system [Olavius algarvensis Delta 1 endosymbiont]
MKIAVSTLLCVVLSIMTISGQIFAEDENAYLSITGPCNLEFPRDHGDHPGYRTEWWYYTGNLRSQNGDHYGFQLTFFRSQISPPGSENTWPRPASAWRTSQVFMAHAAISDIAGKRHLHAEESARDVLGIAGVNRGAGQTKIYIKSWSTRIEADGHVLKVDSPDFSYELNLRPAKPAVLHGDRGYSLKGSTPERASCYYSFTRLDVQGSLIIGDDAMTVSGSAWMDHEFSTALLEPGIIGWDWFSLQFSDATEVMVFLLRNAKGSLHPASSGTFIRVDGTTRPLANAEISVEVLDTWRSKKSGARYPARWRMQILPLSIDAKITSNLPDQEMRTPDSTGVTYWEGSVSVEGMKGKHSVEGHGYVELTGYAEAFDAPM